MFTFKIIEETSVQTNKNRLFFKNGHDLLFNFEPQWLKNEIFEI